ncbi:MAG TPA: hypothetical protein VGO91_04920 [Pyrinomonadaceae bacterium]|jgi:hypothetical protein|nr:hypothetical protein [Pyrinomonadaceae bacterium]
MSLWSVMVRRVMGGRVLKESGSRPGEGELMRLRETALLCEPSLILEAVATLAPGELTELARVVLRERISDAIEVLRACAPCRDLLSGGGYDPIEMLLAFRERIGQRGAQMDIDESGGGGSQRGQGFETWIRFGPINFLTGLSLDGMTLRESQVQVILHELAHAAGDVIPPDGGNPPESVRNQQRITRACLPETYERIRSQEPGASSQ